MDWSNPMAVFGFADEPQTDDGQVDEEIDDFYVDQRPTEDAAHPGVCVWLRLHVNGLTLDPSRRHHSLRISNRLSAAILISPSHEKRRLGTRRKLRCYAPDCLLSARTLPPKQRLVRAAQLWRSLSQSLALVELLLCHLNHLKNNHQHLKCFKHDPRQTIQS